MMIKIVLCFFLMHFSKAQNSETPEEFLKDMTDMVLGALDVFVSGCEPVEGAQINYIYYNRATPDPLILNGSNLKKFVPKLETKIFIHGWYGSVNGSSALALKNAYLKRGDYNVIFVDWASYASVNYARAHCTLKSIGNAIGDFLHGLVRADKLELDEVHLIGHSLGAHLAGYVGQRIQYRTDGLKLFRITGLDAAGPGFLGFPEDGRLDVSDALFVDAIHTNGGQFGYPQDYGDVDFYPNCGLFQPGCLDFDVANASKILEQTMEKLVCSHNKSIRYFVESINSDKFQATPYEGCYLPHECAGALKKFKIAMGEGCSKIARGSYCLITNADSPFARG